MAAPVIVSVTTTKESANTTTFTVNMPSTRPDDDLYVFIGGKDDNPAWTGIPANWIAIESLNSGTNLFAAAWYWFGSSEPATYSLTQDNEEAMGSVFRISGADSTPIDVSGIDANLDQHVDSLSVITTVNDCLVLPAVIVDRYPVTATPATTEVTGGSSNDSGADSAQCGLGIWSTTQATAGSTSTSSFTHSNDDYVRITIAIAPPSTGDQDLSPTGLVSAESFGTAQIDMNVQGLTGIVSTESFGTAVVEKVVVQDLSPTGLASAESFGTAKIDMNVQGMTGLVTAESFGAAQIDLNVQGLTGIPTAESLGAVVVTVGSVDISPASIASTESFGIVGVHCQPLSNPISSFAISSHECSIIQGIGPSGAIPSAESFGTAAVATVQGITPSSLASAESFGTAVITTGAVDVAPTGIASLESFGTALITIDISPSGIASAESFGTPSLSIDIAPTGIVSGESFGTALITIDITPTAIASAESFGATVVTSTYDLSPSSIGSAEAFGTPLITIDIAPTGIASAESFGTAALTTGTVDISPASIASAESIGGHIVGLGSDPDQPIIGIAIASAESFGSATITTGAVDVSPTGIGSAEAFGTHAVTATADISPASIASLESFGTPTLGLFLSPTGISSAESFGSHTVGAAAVDLAPSSIGSLESFGSTAVGITLNISPSSILSAEAVSLHSIDTFSTTHRSQTFRLRSRR